MEYRDDKLQKDKLQYEVEKLIAEVKVLKQPWRLPTFWLGIVALSSSVSYNMYQFYTSDVKKERAETLTTKANLELEKIHRERTELEAERTRLNAELDSQKTALANIKKEIAEAQSRAVNPETKDALQQASKNITQLQQSVAATSESISAPESPATNLFRTKVQTAREKEREGFQALIVSDYARAAAAFQASEDALNGYHSVHEIGKALRDSRSSWNDPATMTEVKRKIVSEHSYLAPSDLLAKLKDTVK